MRLVGRQDELARLRNAFESVRDDRRSRVVVVLGEAGVGKTRLTSEFVSTVENQAQTLVGRCVSYGEGATYLPLAEVVRQAAQIGRSGDRRTARRGRAGSLIAARMSELAGQTEGSASTGELFWRWRSSKRSPQAAVVMVLEDVHWAEPTLLDLIEYLRRGSRMLRC
jgi:predicted ATPase